MIVATELFLALAIAFVLSLLFSWLLKRGAPRRGFPVFFLAIFLITLAGGLWLRPFGPLGLGIYWLPFIVVGIVGSILLFLAAPRRPPANRRETIDMLDRIEQEKELEQLAYLSFNLLMRVLLILLVVAVLAYYFFHRGQ